MRFHTQHGPTLRCGFGCHVGWKGCPDPATTEVLNERNASFGLYCGKHAEKKMDELNEAYAGKEET